MASNLRVDTILPSSGTALGIGTANGNSTVTGDLTALGDVTINGDLGVGGVITYEDVSRVDALGISTFREGFGVGPLTGIALTAYKDGSIRTSGIITASSFVGDIPAGNLTGTVADARISTLTASKLSGALPAIDGSSLTGVGVGTADSINTSGIITATAFIPTQGQLSHRNLIINGAMQIAQRATSNTNDQQGYQTVDRFQIAWGGADSVIEQHQGTLTSSDTGPWEEGFRKEYHLVNGNQSSAGAGDFAQIVYRPEGQDINRSGWNFTDPNSKVTISYWIKSDVAQNYYGFIEGSSTRIYAWETGALTANTWKKVTVTIPGFASLAIPDTTASAFSLAFIPFYGTNYTASNRPIGQWYTAYNYFPDMASTWWTTDNATFQITGVQLEVGSVATPFEHRKFQDDLYNCQRYYQQVGKVGQDGDFCIGASHLTSNGDQTRVGYYGQNQFRATPTITEFGNGLKVIGGVSKSITDVTAISDINVTFPSAFLQFNCEMADIGDNYEIVVITNQNNSGIKINAEL